jgi:hypothetical protein
MPVLSGNTTGSIAGEVYNIPATIRSFVLTNKTGGSITVTVAIIEQGTNNTVVSVAPTVIAANDTYTSDVPILMRAGFTIYISTSGSLDYYFTIE